jgi:1-acyl-sn-glycerol-3-phosphate acyltransferase
MLFHLLGRVKITGLQNVPQTGAYLVAFNHVSLYDAPFVIAFWPTSPEVASASDIWQRKGQDLLVRWYAGIPVHRGQYDRRLVDTLLSALRSGYPLVIAPEGGRSHSPGMRPANPGVAYLAEKTGVPVIPVGVVGTTEDYLENALRGRRPTLEMHIGEPVLMPPVVEKGASRRETRQRNADLVMSHIAKLLPAEYRGYYADHEILSGNLMD